MLNVNTRTKTILRSNCRTFRTRLLIGGIEYNGITNFNYQTGCEANEIISIGSTYSNTLEFDISDTVQSGNNIRKNNVVLKGKKVDIYIGVVVDDEPTAQSISAYANSMDNVIDTVERLSDGTYKGLLKGTVAVYRNSDGTYRMVVDGESDTGDEELVEYTKVGETYINEVNFNDDSVHVVSFDIFSYMNDMFDTDLSGEVSVNAVLSVVESITGVSCQRFNDSVMYPDIDRLKEMSCRNVIGAIASYMGKNAIVNNVGRIEFKWYTDINRLIEPSRVKSPITVGDKEVHITRVTCSYTKIVETQQEVTNEYGVTTVETVTSEETDYLTVGDDTGDTLSFASPIMTQERLNMIASEVIGLRYYPTSIDWSLAEFDVQCGDILTVKANYGTLDNMADYYYIVPVMQLNFECDGGLYGTFTALPSSTISNATEEKGSISQAVEDLSGQVAEFKKLSVESLNAVNANITHLRTEDIEGTNGKINLANGTFDYGNGALKWDGEKLGVKGNVEANEGIFGNKNNHYYKITEEALTAYKTSVTYILTFAPYTSNTYTVTRTNIGGGTVTYLNSTELGYFGADVSNGDISFMKAKTMATLEIKDSRHTERYRLPLGSYGLTIRGNTRVQLEAYGLRDTSQGNVLYNIFNHCFNDSFGVSTPTSMTLKFELNYTSDGARAYDTDGKEHRYTLTYTYNLLTAEYDLVKDVIDDLKTGVELGWNELKTSNVTISSNYVETPILRTVYGTERIYRAFSDETFAKYNSSASDHYNMCNFAQEYEANKYFMKQLQGNANFYPKVAGTYLLIARFGYTTNTALTNGITCAITRTNDMGESKSSYKMLGRIYNRGIYSWTGVISITQDMVDVNLSSGTVHGFGIAVNNLETDKSVTLNSLGVEVIYLGNTYELEEESA